MSISRRYLLRLGPVYLVASAVCRPVLAEDAVAPDAMLSMTPQDWIPLLGSSFDTRTTEGKSAWLTLAGVDDLTANISGSTRLGPMWETEPLIQTFALKFTGTGEPLSQGTYQFENSKMGRVEVFIVPGADQGYTAIISHLTRPLPEHYSVPKALKTKTRGSAVAENRPQKAFGSPAGQTDAVMG